MQSDAPKRGLTLSQANLLLLVSLALILFAGILASNWHFYWTLLIREVLFVLGPALLFLFLLGLPWRETIRWEVPNWRVLGASVLIGLGGWLFDVWLGTFFGELLGYTLPLPPDFYPTDVLQALILFCMLAVVAPICEELLFRGLIQRGYEQLGAWPSIVLTGLLFALFHQSLAQGLALLPLAILLSWLAWRTDSLPACILAHAVNNTPAALLIPLSVLLPQLGAASDSAPASGLATDLASRISAISPVILMLPAALFGGLLLVGGLWGIRRWCPPPPPLRREPLRPGFDRWLGRTWPLLLILPLTLFVIGAELAMGRYPEQLSMGRPVQFTAPPWDTAAGPGSQTWRYTVRNVLDEDVGTIECTLEPTTSTYDLACSRRRAAYEADTGSGVYDGRDLDESTATHWQRADLRLQAVDRSRVQDIGWRSFSAAPRGDSVGITLSGKNGPRALSLPIPEPTFLSLPNRAYALTVIEHSEWPWRFSALPFQGFYSAQAALIDPDPPEGGDPTLTSTSIVIYGSEPIATPAGTYIAWRVQVGPDHVAWYDSEAPHTLVALEDGIEKWVLISAE